MKRLLLVLLVCFMTACSLNNNSKQEAIETLFERYRNKDDNVISQLKEVIMAEKLLDKQKEDYQELMEKQYNSLGYVIKDIKEENDTAVATIEITVLNYRSAIDKAEEELKTNPEKFNDDKNNFSEEKYMDYKIELMKKVDETTTYTLELNLYKEKGMWIIEELSSNDISKIHGLY